MTNFIPNQLKNKVFRFCILPRGSKVSQVNHNNPNNQFLFDDKHLLDNINLGSNYGILCGIGNLLVMDFDDRETYNQLNIKLPPTMEVNTPSNNKHKFYTTSTPKRTKRYPGRIDLLGLGNYAVGCNSRLKDNTNYTLQEDLPIAILPDETYNNIISILEKLPKKEPTKKNIQISHYEPKEPYFLKPTDFIFIKVIRQIKDTNGNIKWDILIRTPNNEEKTIQLNLWQFDKLIRDLFPHHTITLQANYYKPKGQILMFNGKPALFWEFLNSKCH